MDTRLPMTSASLLRKRHNLRKQLLAQPDLLSSRIAVLGGSTTAEVKSMLELFLLYHGIRPTFFESGYKRYHEDVLFENPELIDFKPDVVFIHTTWQNVSEFPGLNESEDAVGQRIDQEMAGFISMWDKISSNLGAVIIQNNFDLPHERPIGNLETSESYGRINFLMRLNAEFATYARRHPQFLINDILYLSAKVGLDVWHSPVYWYSFHMAVSPEATIAVAKNVAGIIKSIYGKSKKCLVLDLDNTLWGGVIGDDGMQNLILGSDHPVGEAFLDFQRYVKTLQRRGVILAVCSKNDASTAREGFSHPDSVLKIEDFSAFKANWDPKPANIRAIAAELNIGLESMVFLDDSPSERAFVREQLPEVSTPEVGPDVSSFVEVLESERYFEVHTIVQDDLNRSMNYKSDFGRKASQSSFSDYGEFLASLAMKAEIAPFSQVYLERIAQLVNKTNQFNLTTRRYTSSEIGAIAGNSRFITLYGRLADKFGDHGLVSVVIGREVNETLELDLWVMSCRVLNRELELAMFDALVEKCQEVKIRRIQGTYIPSKKNGIVKDLYRKLGFMEGESSSDGQQTWNYAVPVAVKNLSSRYIARTKRAAGLDADAKASFSPTTMPRHPEAADARDAEWATSGESN
jgi:FkbH-like protein